jgi:hypothetical protein
MSFREFTKALRHNDVESNLLKTTFLSLLTSFVLLFFIYYVKLRHVTNFLPKYGFFLFFAVLSYALIMPSVKYVRTYKEFQCMSGMMIGMTMGMFSGFLSGFFIGATNGMFVGSIFGMLVGMFFGIWNGKCCGIMGTMEGMMAGLMGGLMGAMTAIMMLNDNLKAAGIIIFIISAVTMTGLNYMIYKETRGAEVQNRDGDFFTVFWSLLLTLITLWIMVFGPRSALFQ